MDIIEFGELAPAAQKKRFHEEHGECYRDGDSCILYYGDGAVLEDFGYGVFHFPPDPKAGDEQEYLLYWRKLKFAQLKLRRAVKAFDNLNTILAQGRPADPDAALADLKRLQAAVNQQKALVAQAERTLSDTARGRAQAAARRQREEEDRRIAEFQSQREAIRV
ncbi:MAG: hypothetical protein AB9869_32805 [Verrucomicrobiia bacterium]